jgi:hypothetical protein
LAFHNSPAIAPEWHYDKLSEEILFKKIHKSPKNHIKFRKFEISIVYKSIHINSNAYNRLNSLLYPFFRIFPLKPHVIAFLRGFAVLLTGWQLFKKRIGPGKFISHLPLTAIKRVSYKIIERIIGSIQDSPRPGFKQKNHIW